MTAMPSHGRGHVPAPPESGVVLADADHESEEVEREELGPESLEIQVWRVLEMRENDRREAAGVARREATFRRRARDEENEADEAARWTNSVFAELRSGRSLRDSLDRATEDATAVADAGEDSGGRPVVVDAPRSRGARPYPSNLGVDVRRGVAWGPDTVGASDSIETQPAADDYVWCDDCGRWVLAETAAIHGVDASSGELWMAERDSCPISAEPVAAGHEYGLYATASESYPNNPNEEAEVHHGLGDRESGPRLTPLVGWRADVEGHEQIARGSAFACASADVVRERRHHAPESRLYRHHGEATAAMQRGLPAFDSPGGVYRKQSGEAFELGPTIRAEGEGAGLVSSEPAEGTGVTVHGRFGAASSASRYSKTSGAGRTDRLGTSTTECTVADTISCPAEAPKSRALTTHRARWGRTQSVVRRAPVDPSESRRRRAQDGDLSASRPTGTTSALAQSMATGPPPRRRAAALAAQLCLAFMF